MKSNQSTDKCEWNSDDDGIWQTDCGESFVFIDDGPKENGMKFCCYCGKQLVSARVGRKSEVGE